MFFGMISKKNGSDRSTLNVSPSRALTFFSTSARYSPSSTIRHLVTGKLTKLLKSSTSRTSILLMRDSSSTYWSSFLGVMTVSSR